MAQPEFLGILVASNLDLLGIYFTVRQVQYACYPFTGMYAVLVDVFNVDRALPNIRTILEFSLVQAAISVQLSQSSRQ